VVDWTGGNIVFQLEGGRIENVATFNVAAGVSLTKQLISPGRFENTGTVKVAAAAGKTTRFLVRFNNSGIVELAANGDLEFRNGGNHNAGVFLAASGSTIRFTGGTNEFNHPIPLLDYHAFQGQGQVQLSGGTLAINPWISLRASRFQMSGGRICGSGWFGANSFSWFGGTMMTAGNATSETLGITEVRTGDRMTIAGNVTLSSRKIVNRGTIAWLSNNITFVTHGTIVTDGEDARFEVFSDPSGIQHSIEYDPTQFSLGRFVVMNGGELVRMVDEYGILASILVPVDNHGGKIIVDDPLRIYGLTQTAGELRIQSEFRVRGGNVQTGGTATIESSGSLIIEAGTGWHAYYDVSEGSLWLNGGTIEKTDGICTLQVSETGLFSGWGLVSVNIHNTGQVKLDSGVLTVYGEYQQQEGGVLHVVVDRLLSENGISFNRLDIHGNAFINGGMLQATMNNGMPQVNDSFRFMTFETKLGTGFSGTQLQLGGGLYFDLETGPDRLTLVTKQQQ
jgi:hypothetical protein